MFSYFGPQMSTASLIPNITVLLNFICHKFCIVICVCILYMMLNKNNSPCKNYVFAGRRFLFADLTFFQKHCRIFIIVTEFAIFIIELAHLDRFFNKGEIVVNISNKIRS